MIRMLQEVKVPCFDIEGDINTTRLSCCLQDDVYSHK